MTKVMNKWLLAGAVVSAMCTSVASAKVSEEKAAQLGGEIYTPMGSIRAGNEDGSIPAWTGGITEDMIPEGYQEGDHHPDPFADDEKLFTIDASNYQQYAEHLTVGRLLCLKPIQTASKCTSIQRVVVPHILSMFWMLSKQTLPVLS